MTMPRILYIQRNGVILRLSLKLRRASLVAQMVKNLPAMQETWIQSLGWQDPLEKGTAILELY